MSEREALHAAICANPDEDTPRLAFADFLEEQGGKESVFRAAYIRGAIRLAREELWSPAWHKARDAWDKYDTKVRQQAADHKLKWTAHLKGRARAFEFDRGFVGHITVFSKRFVAEGEKFFAADPIRSVKFVTLTASSGTVTPKELFACPHLSRALRLALDGSGLTDNDLKLMAASKHLANVQTVSLAEHQRFSAKGLLELIQKLPAVRELQMPHSYHVDDAFAGALAGTPAFEKLTALDLSEHNLSAKGLAKLLATKHGENLRELRAGVGLVEDDYDPDETDDGDYREYPEGEAEWRFSPEDGKRLAAVLAKCQFPNLRFLDASGWRMGDKGLEALAGGGFPALRQLELGTNDLTRKGLESLGNSPLGKQLVYVGTGFDEGLWDEKVMRAVRKIFPNAHVTGYGV